MMPPIVFATLFTKCDTCNFKNHLRVKKCMMCDTSICQTKHALRPSDYYYKKLKKKYQEFVEILSIKAINAYGIFDKKNVSQKCVFNQLCCDLADLIAAFPNVLKEPRLSEFEMNWYIDLWASNIKHIGLLNRGSIYKKYCDFIYIDLMLIYTSEYTIMY
jgi:hypothetical protein